MAKNKLTVDKLYGKKKLILGLALLFGFLSAIIILVTYYGQNVGSYSIRLDGSLEDRKVFISTDPEFSWYNSRLEADPVKNANATSMRFIRTDICKATNGSYVGANKGYISYTFYLKNMGAEAIDIDEIVQISSATQNLDDVSWLWYFEDDNSGTIYQKEDTNIPSDWSGYLSDYPETVKFESDTVILSKTIKNFMPNEVKKFTLIVWMESLDPNLSIDNSGGLIRFDVAFSIKRDTL